MIVLPAYAKLNLALEVTGRRSSGLHTLESVIVRIDWHDLVAVEPGGDAAIPSLVIDGGDRLPAGDDNLAVRGAMVAAELAGVAPPSSVWLGKRVPAAAGLGGGSADAAAAMAAVRSLAGTAAAHIKKDAWTEAAARVGSDVPALLAGGAQLVGGTGEVLEPLPTPRLDLVVVIAGASSTAATFAALQPAEVGDGGRAAALAAQLRSGGWLDETLFGSALEAAATRAGASLGAEIAAVRDAVPEMRWHLTGSGGALFAVSHHAKEAAAIAMQMRGAGRIARACRTVG